MDHERDENPSLRGEKRMMVLFFTTVLCQSLSGSAARDDQEGYQYRHFKYFPCVRASASPSPENRATVRNKGKLPPKIAIRKLKNPL
jgi:hypothetical protein